MTNPRPLAAFIAATVSLVVIDLSTKWWAVGALSNSPRELPGPVDLQLAYNSGTAFGLFSNLPTIVVSIITIAFVAVVVNMWRTHRAPTVPVALIVAGGIANVIDRLESGSVVDMLYTSWWPTFNLADIYITTGVTWWIITTIRTPNATTATAESIRGGAAASPDRYDDSGDQTCPGKA
ncbi:MAG: signal peptidase II [Ilumatobacter sp.]|uniref:signal peptidase II n=1 Tax=Ilumatobacter sp. TaxID=1967498 RepID=UPI003299315D